VFGMAARFDVSALLDMSGQHTYLRGGVGPGTRIRAEGGARRRMMFRIR